MAAKGQYQRLTRFAAASLLSLILVVTVLTHEFMARFEGEPVSWGRALLFALETITTVGYGDLLPFESVQMTALTVVTILTGVSLFFFLGANLAAHWLEERVVPRAPTATKLEGHLVLTRFSEMVEEFAHTLRELEVPFILMARDEAEALALSDGGFDVVLGSADDPDALRRANLHRARAVVACGSDADNIGAALAARSVGDVPVVALADRRESVRFLELAGARLVISPKRAMGRGLVDWTIAVPTPADWPPPMAVEPGAEAIAELNPSVFYITDGSPLAKMTISDVGRRTRALIAGLWRGDELVLNPDPDTAVLGTALIAVGEEADVAELARLASGEDGHGRVVVAGYGDVGGEVARRLERAGVDVTVLDARDTGREGQAVGDATTSEALEAAGVPTARTLILTLDDDNVSIQAALVARTLNPRLHISARAVDGGSLPKYQWAGVDHPLSIPTVANRMLLQALVRLGAMRTPFDAVAARRPAGALEGGELRSGDIRRRTGCLVVAIVDGEKVIPAHGGERVNPGAELILLGTREQVRRYEALFEGDGGA